MGLVVGPYLPSAERTTSACSHLAKASVHQSRPGHFSLAPADRSPLNLAPPAIQCRTLTRPQPDYDVVALVLVSLRLCPLWLGEIVRYDCARFVLYPFHTLRNTKDQPIRARLAQEAAMPRAESNAETIADFIVALSQKHGDLITNLKLQKLLYYAEGWYLALYNRSLFSEPIEAWVRGPAVYSVWKRYNDFKWKPITRRVQPPEIPERVAKHLEEIMIVYGDFSALKLEKMTHEELPWQNARRHLQGHERSSEKISREDMKAYFKQLARGA